MSLWSNKYVISTISSKNSKICCGRKIKHTLKTFTLVERFIAEIL